MSMMTAARASALLLAILGSCSPGPRQSASDAAAGIDSLNARLVQAYRARDPQAYGALYTDSAVFEWPAPKTYALGLTRVPDYMYFSIDHWQPLAVGYSGGYARETLMLLERVAEFPSPESLQALQRHQVRYLILHSEPDPAGYVDVVNALSNRPEVRFAFYERTVREEHAVYNVVPLP